MPTVTEQQKREFVKKYEQKFYGDYKKDEIKDFIENIAKPELGYSKETRWNKIYSSLYNLKDIMNKELMREAEMKEKAMKIINSRPVKQKSVSVKAFEPGEPKIFKTFPITILTSKLEEIKKRCQERKLLTGRTTIQHDWILEAIDEKLQKETV